MIIMIIMTLFKSQVYTTGQRPTNRGHHIYHPKVDRDFSYDRRTHINTDMSSRIYGLTSLFEKMQKSNHLQDVRAKATPSLQLF